MDDDTFLLLVLFAKTMNNPPTSERASETGRDEAQQQVYASVNTVRILGASELIERFCESAQSAHSVPACSPGCWVHYFPITFSLLSHS